MHDFIMILVFVAGFAILASQITVVYLIMKGLSVQDRVDAHLRAKNARRG